MTPNGFMRAAGATPTVTFAPKVGAKVDAVSVTAIGLNSGHGASTRKGWFTSVETVSRTVLGDMPYGQIHEYQDCGGVESDLILSSRGGSPSTISQSPVPDQCRRRSRGAANVQSPCCRRCRCGVQNRRRRMAVREARPQRTLVEFAKYLAV